MHYQGKKKLISFDSCAKLPVHSDSALRCFGKNAGARLSSTELQNRRGQLSWKHPANWSNALSDGGPPHWPSGKAPAWRVSELLFVGCLMSQQPAGVSQGRICSDNFTCCPTEIEVADQAFYLTLPHRADQSQC